MDTQIALPAALTPPLGALAIALALLGVQLIVLRAIALIRACTALMMAIVNAVVAMHLALRTISHIHLSGRPPSRQRTRA